MKLERSAGILLHPTSLPGAYGIGDLGPEAYRWIDFLVESGNSLWQVLPLGPTGYGDSPYQSFSSFAGNPYLVSPELLVRENLLTLEDLANHPDFPLAAVDYGAIIPWKLGVLDKAFDRFQAGNFPEIQAELEDFSAANSFWLDDFALFMALKESHGGQPWPTWEPALRSHDRQALEALRQDQAIAVQRQVFRQFLFFRQWTALRLYAGERGMRIIGDMPIFVAHDSADVWSHPELFYLDDSGNPTVVAGVPPDYYSPTGQLWGNPLYRWTVHAQTGYSWWLARLRKVLEMVDYIRLDHFRGFGGYWEVPAGLPTAEKGRWVRGPGEAFFTAIESALGELPLIAEDLGEISPDVVALREKFNFPGMKVMQFAFLNSDPNDQFMPHNYVRNCVAYTGTHDNDTTLGWFKTTPAKEREFGLKYLGRDGSDIVWDMIRAVWSSVAVFALAPMQDILTLDTQARMNFPGKPSGNWTWRMPPWATEVALKSRLPAFNFLYGRSPEARKIQQELKVLY